MAGRFDAGFDPEGRRLPIKLNTASNGEYLPLPLSPATRAAHRLAHERATATAKRLGLTRRAFLKSLPGAAATLLAMNEACAGFGKTGGFYALPTAAAFEPAAAHEAIGGDELIFDVQTHHVNPNGAWRRSGSRWNQSLAGFPQARCGEDPVQCFSVDHFIHEVFLDSDTDMAVLSAVPAAPEDNPLSTEEAAATRALVDTLGKQGGRGHRLMIHGLVLPMLPGALDYMAKQKNDYQVAAWKTYTQWGPQGKGYWLDDPKVGIPFIERARELDVKLICVHKGLPLFGLEHEHSTCRDIGVVARTYPDVSFIVYHSGYEPAHQEGPYDPDKAMVGVDSLVRSLADNGIGPNGNVYAELGSTWRLVMRDPDQAAHLLGKLFKYVGEERVLWGTDSIWYGSPQDQIQAFRAFQIAEPLRERYGYPEITPELRAKVFGLNATKPYKVAAEEIRKYRSQDPVGKARQSYREDPDPSFLTYGPKTRREFLALHALTGGRP